MTRRLILVVLAIAMTVGLVALVQHVRRGEDALRPGAASGALVGLGDVALRGVTVCRGQEDRTSEAIAADPLCRPLPAGPAVALAEAIAAAPEGGNRSGVACSTELGLTYTLTFAAGTARTVPLRYVRCPGTITVRGRTHAVEGALLGRIATAYEVGTLTRSVVCPAEVVVDDAPPVPVCSDRTATVTARVGQRLTVQAPVWGAADPAVTLNLVVAVSVPADAGGPPPEVLALENAPGRLDADGRPLPDTSTVRRLTATAPGRERLVIGADVCREAGDPCRAGHLEPAVDVTVTP